MSTTKDTSQEPVNSIKCGGLFKSTDIFKPKIVGKHTLNSMLELAMTTWINIDFFITIDCTSVTIDTFWYSNNMIPYKFDHYPEEEETFYQFESGKNLSTSCSFADHPKLKPGKRLPLADMLPRRFYCYKSDVLNFLQKYRCGLNLTYTEENQAKLDNFCKDKFVFMDENGKVFLENPPELNGS